ncbi:response regulator [Larkinella soli]|uniref:response regulator n=1 Tax=Larkinella soli TaxID=1770527 RepID=UPI000FFBC0E2|nr:response regulator [Larkinella soli]
MAFPQNKYRKNRKNARILVIEDQTDQWTLILQALESQFPEVQAIWKSSAPAATTFLEECADAGSYPQLILLDLYLPERETGLNMLGTIRRMTNPARQCPVVVLSHSDSPVDIREAYDLGANSYIAKPLNQDDWMAYFQTLREYWWQAVMLPDSQSCFPG